MPTIDFYIINDLTIDAKFRFACKLLEKAYQLNNKTYVYSSNAIDAKQIYDTLWTFRDISFVPHEMADEKNSYNAPIVIGLNEPPISHQDILFNLSKIIPDFFTKFNRIIEIVIQDPDWQKISRTHYKEYRDKGFQIETHDLRK